MKRIGDRDIRFDEAYPIIGGCRLCVGVDGLLRLGTEVRPHCGVPLQKITLGLHDGSITLVGIFRGGETALPMPAREPFDRPRFLGDNFGSL